MNETQLAILRGCCANFGDWPRWDILSDSFRDEGDDIGADWALWVKEKRRWPFARRVYNIPAKQWSKHERWSWALHWYYNKSGFDGLPPMLFDSMESDDEFGTNKLPTCEEAFLDLLNGWRGCFRYFKASQDKVKMQLFNWKP